MIALDELNRAAAPEFITALGAIFEHSPWVAERVAGMRPFRSSIDLHRAMSQAVMQAPADLQTALIRAHPELAGRAAQRGELTAASTGEQKGAGLNACTEAQLQSLTSLNAHYRERFAIPFILAVKGHTPDSVIAALTERVAHDAKHEHRVALEEICRIARFRLADLIEEPWGDTLIAMLEDLATLSETEDALTCSYLTPAHRATAQRIREHMLAAGLSVHMDAVGNVIGILPGAVSGARRVLTGSHYDTVINAGKYDGRLGILLPIVVAGSMRRAGVRLPFPLEIVAFAEEEGVRFKSTFLGSRAVVGRFDLKALDSIDAQGVTLRQALAAANRDVAAIGAAAHDPKQVACFVEVHIEQGPVLLDAGLAVGVVSSIAGSRRSIVTVNGASGHAGTVPMGLRRDAAAAAAEMVLAVERRCSAEPGLVGTVGRLDVPGGAINVIAGRCEFSIDIRSGSDELRDAAHRDIGAEIQRIAQRRGVAVEQAEVLEAASVPCNPRLQDAWAASVQRVTGRPALRLPSGAGHDAMMMASLTGIGMLFVRCGNGGISHHPDETLSAADADVAARVFEDFLQHYDPLENLDPLDNVGPLEQSPA
jgi:allantoate deiminase/N-carbamoyl-L-amino-acid hydrolase